MTLNSSGSERTTKAKEIAHEAHHGDIFGDGNHGGNHGGDGNAGVRGSDSKVLS
jgi:membrane protein involved in colicin uptake